MADPYLTVDQLRSQLRMSKGLDDYNADELAAYVTEFEDIAERYLNCAFRIRTATLTTFDAGYLCTVRLPNTFVSAVTAATVDGDDEYDVTGWALDALGTVTVQTSKVSAITYTHGLPDPPQALLRACREYVRSCALRDKTGRSADVQPASADGATFNYSTPDWDAGRPTGYREVDRLLNSVDRVIVVA